MTTPTASAPISQAPQGAAPPLPVPTTAAKRTGWIVGVIALAVLFLLYLVVFYGIGVGSTVGLIAAIASLLPFVIVVVTVLRVDRWEPEPKPLLWFAALWGLVGSIALTDLYLMTFGTADEYAAGVIQAPILEEITKGIGVFLIFLFARRYFDGPVDGLVYGGLIGAGFAFTENIQYLGNALASGGFEAMGGLLITRGLMSPFVHSIATGLTGLALGYAVRRGFSRGGAFGFGLLGLLGAMAFHSLWNFLASTGLPFFLWYFVVEVPLFAIYVWGVVFILRQEEKVTHRRLGEYRDAGWFTAQEVDLLATSRGRRQAIAWARTQGGDRSPQMKKFIQAATGLAFARERAISGRDPLAGAVDEPAFLQATLAARAEYLRAVSGAPGV